MAIVKNLKQHPPLPPSRYDVGIYCRVSTASKTQVVSIGHQLSGLIADVANSHQARLYDVYLDIQSGRTSDNRKNLMRLLDDCRAGRVTPVYTKFISRIARNTVDVLTIIRELKKKNVPVYFENEPEEEGIRQVFRLYLDGYSVGGIKKYLEEKGTLTSRGKTTWSKLYLNASKMVR